MMATAVRSSPPPLHEVSSSDPAPLPATNKPLLQQQQRSSSPMAASLPYKFVGAICDLYDYDPLDSFVGDGQTSTVYFATKLDQPCGSPVCGTPPSARGSPTTASAPSFFVVQPSTPQYALKVMKKPEAPDGTEQHSDFNRRVIKEVAVLRCLSGHGHCLQLVEVFQTSSAVCIVTNIAPGKELYYNIQQRNQARCGQPYAEREALGVLRQVMLGLQHMHENGVVHRDVKTENIMCTESNFVTLIDYGLAKTCWQKTASRSNSAVDATDQGASSEDKIVAPDADDAHPCTPCGSYYYVPPETLAHLLSITWKRKPDRTFGQLTKSDIYAAGVVLHLLLTGSYPFHPSSGTGGAPQLSNRQRLGAVLTASRKGPDLDNKSLRHLSATTKELLAAMLHPQAAERPSASEVLARLPLFNGTQIPLTRSPSGQQQSIVGQRCSVVGIAATANKASSGQARKESAGELAATSGSYHGGDRRGTSTATEVVVEGEG